MGFGHILPTADSVIPSFFWDNSERGPTDHVLSRSVRALPGAEPTYVGMNLTSIEEKG